ncbi:MAG: ComF family protein [Candidatus Pacebacteria bacterium]|nr:ComF family protein [Candidatus Paceibacterota bacterium]
MEKRKEGTWPTETCTHCRSVFTDTMWRDTIHPIGMFSILYRTVIDALFPLSSAEQELFLLSPKEALQELNRAPDYSGLAVPLPGARSVFAYKDERVAKLVWSIKYKRSAQAVKIGGYALFQVLASAAAKERDFEGAFGPSVDEGERAAASADADGVPRTNLLSLAAAPYKQIIVIPTPITAQRRRERGYNQCELLLDELERLAKELIDPTLEPNAEQKHYIFERNLLIRTQHAERQTLKGREDRVESAQGIFGVNEKAIGRLRIEILKDLGAAIEKMPIIIVDDVITTGSTMHEAIETLRKAGFENVRALSLAH